jgi:hypothetical protein
MLPLRLGAQSCQQRFLNDEADVEDDTEQGVAIEEYGTGGTTKKSNPNQLRIFSPTLQSCLLILLA